MESEKYCLACYRYIELNPVRAGMCAAPEDYRWSSYRVNALGAENPGLTPHAQWLALGASGSDRREGYRELVQQGIEPERVESIRYGLRKGLPTGSSRFSAQIEEALDRRLGDGRRGRPRVKSEKGL